MAELKNTIVNGKLVVNGQQKITLSTGVAPLVINSTTKVENLNADMLDGLHVSDLVKKTAFSYDSTTKTLTLSLND